MRYSSLLAVALICASFVWTGQTAFGQAAERPLKLSPNLDPQIKKDHEELFAIWMKDVFDKTR